MKNQDRLLTGEELDKLGKRKEPKTQQNHQILTRKLQAFGPQVYWSWKCRCEVTSDGIFKTEREANQDHLLHVSEVAELKVKGDGRQPRRYTAKVRHNGDETVKCPGCLSRLGSTFLTKRSLRWINERHKDAMASVERQRLYKQYQGEQEVPYEEISSKVAVVIARFVKLSFREAMERFPQ